MLSLFWADILIKIRGMMLRRTFIVAQVILVLLVGLLLFEREWPAFGTEDDQLNAIVSQDRFDFLVWETNAFLAKAQSILGKGHTFLDEAERKEVVLTYLALLREAQGKDAEITRLYSDPEVSNPDAASAEMQADLAHIRAEMAALQPIAEAILQDQVSTILVEEGFAVAGQAWPPVMMHMTPLPSLLVTSPRDRIERTHQRSLVPGLTTPDKEVLETAVAENLDLSALVVPIGGMGTYPAMIMETSDINWLTEVIAHEWSHHWMQFYPVGIYYLEPDVRVINETIASMIDVEIREKVIERYYPEFMPEPVPETETDPLPEPAEPEEPPPFDFGAEMAETRVRADELLAEGKIEEAEAYMEERRQLFWENGYQIRKLNQAYFAFYGAYAAQPGATGLDPTGPMLRGIRAHSPSLRAFMDTIAPIASLEDLEQIWEETQTAN